MTWRCLFPPPGKAKLLEFPSLGWAKNWTRRQCFVCAVLESVYVGWSELRLTATLFTHTWRSQGVALGLPVSDLRWGKPSGRLVLPPCNYILPSCDKNTNMLHLKHCGGKKCTTSYLEVCLNVWLNWSVLSVQFCVGWTTLGIDFKSHFATIQ